MAGLSPTLERAREKTVTRPARAKRTGPRLLMSWEDWLTLFAVSLVFLSLAGSLQGANLVRNMPPMIPTAMGAMLLGLFAARIQSTQAIIHVGGLLLGSLVVLLAVQGYADGATIQDRIVDIRIRMQEWFAIVRAGDISNDNLPFVLLIHSLTFLAAYFGTWATYRWHTPWIAVLPAGLFLLINISLLRGQPSTAFVFYLFGALLLVARMHLQKRQATWRRNGIEYPEFISLSVAQLTVTLAAGLMIAAWLVPLGTQARVVESAVSTAMKPVNSQTDFFVRMFHNLDASRSGNFHSYGDVLPIRGDVSLGSRELFRVQGLVDGLSDEQLRLLRGASYDEYTGVGWRATDRERLRIDGGGTAVTQDAAYQKREFRSLDFTITSGESTVFFEGSAFGTNLDSSVEVPDAFSADVEHVRSRRGLREGDSYSSVGTVSFATADDLRLSGTDYPDWVMERYLQLPAELPDRVFEQAFQISGGAATPFDKAVVLEEYLRTFPYDLEVPAAPPGRDPVDYLLFDLQRGYFDYMSSAMAVMLRTQGVPARVAVGYAVDLDDPDSRLTGAYAIQRNDAYSWVEVFFPSYGWIAFNPTQDRPATSGSGGGTLPDQTDIGQFPITEPILDDLFDDLGGEFPIGSGTGGALQTQPNVQGAGFPWWVVWTLLGAMAAAAAIVGAGMVSWNWGLGNLEARARLWAKAQRLGGWAGMGTRDEETPREWSRRMGQAVGQEEAAVNLASAYEESRYGRPDLQRIEEAEATEAYRQIRSSLLRRIVRRREQLPETPPEEPRTGPKLDH